MTRLVFDDTEPQLRYFGTWFLGGSPNEFNSTAHGTREPGASVEFLFTGTSVEVRGSVSQAGLGAPTPISTYVLDGGLPVTFSPTQTAAAQFNQIFFQSQVPNGTHSLSITSAVDQSLFWLDSIVVTTASSSNTSDAVGSQSFLSNNTDTSATSSRTIAPGVVFGIAIGSSLVLGGVIAVLIYLVRRRRRHPTRDGESRVKSVLTPKRKETRVTAFMSQSSKKILVIPPSKDPPPVSTNRYEYPVVKLSAPKPAARRAKPYEPPLTDLPERRLRPAHGLGLGQSQSPPRRPVLVSEWPGWD
ncbi:hypothetical protein C8R44DRAFT_789889 [Mycena epipterygia]|nr:hypothetical protein C8R44DRAFT_789889 [Mycena epipterygia]